MFRLLGFLSLLVGLAFGHNWMISPSRVPNAATMFPCMAKRSNLPHVQVAVGQEFLMEWATGHSQNVYFALISKEDSDKLSKHNTRADGPLEGYIQEAPQQLLDSSLSPMLCPNCKYHWTRRFGNATHAMGGTVASHYAQEITAGPYFRPRPTEFGTSKYQWAYISSPDDRYVSYHNPKWPWIKSVWRYEIQEADGTEGDFARFTVPTSAGPGDYVMHYLWSGYYDCIDINVVNASLSGGNLLPFPYGNLPTGDRVISNRIDHCIFDEPTYFISFPRAVYGGLEEAAAGCIRNCKDSYEQSFCNSVSVFPLSLISRNWGPHWDSNNNLVKTFYETAWSINQQWGNSVFGLGNGDSHYPFDRVSINASNVEIYSGIWRIYQWITTGTRTRYTFTGYNATTLATVRALVESGTGQADPWTCVMTTSRSPTTTADKYTIVDDPLDPVWYSTCYEIVERRDFLGFDPATKATPEVQHVFPTSLKSGCISCQDAVNWRYEAYTPTWNIQDRCERCEKVTGLTTQVSKYPKTKTMGAVLSFDSATATADTTLCNNKPPEFASYSDYCLIPHMWSHPLLADYRADASNWKWRSIDALKPYSDITTKVGWFPGRLTEWTTQSQAFCSALINKDPLCSSIAEYWDTTTLTTAQIDGCRCLRQDPCCLKYYRISASGATYRRVFDTRFVPSPALDPGCNATTSLLSQDGTRCCVQATAGDCGGTGCGSAPGVGLAGNRNGGTMCRGSLIPEDRCCRDYAPPCTMCA